LESKNYDVFIGLVRQKIDLGEHVPNKWLHLTLRGIHKLLENEQSVQLSIKARAKYTIPKVKRGVAEPAGTELEHIIPVRHIVKKILRMYLWEGWTDREEIERFIEKTFYGVYKLKKIEHDTQEYDAEELIMEQFRTEQVKYFNEYTPKR
tara:strand:- start:2979 stop:3428 length:450 start_codon:yes stop_codon:yes gene_type:complete